MDKIDYNNTTDPYLYPEPTNPMNLQEQIDTIQSAQSGDNDAMEKMVSQFERLCHKLSRKFAFTASTFTHEDLLQEARIGLMKAVMTYDPKHGAKPITWMYYSIRGAVVSAGRSDRKQPAYPYSIEDCPRAYNIEDPSARSIVNDDLP